MTPKTIPSPRLTAIAALLTAMAAFQGGASLARGLFPLIGAEGATTLRLGLAAVMMLLIWRPWRGRPIWRIGWPILGYGVALGGMTLLYYMALRTLPQGVAVALEFTGPLGLTVITSRRGIDFLWVACAVAGIGLLAPLGPAAAPIDPGGALMAMASGACWALYIVFGQKAGAGDKGQTLAYGVLIAALVAAPFGLAHAGSRLLTLSLLPTALAVALLTSVIPYCLDLVAMTRLPTKTFGMLLSLEPAIAVLAGLVFLGQNLNGRQALAVAAIIAASAGSIMTHKAAAPTPPPN